MSKGWITTNLGNVANIYSGATPSTTNPSYWGDAVAWITPDDLSKLKTRYISRGERSLSKEGYDSITTPMLPAGSVLISSRAPIGYVALAGDEVCTNQGFKSLVLKTGHSPHFFYYLAKLLKPAFEAKAGITTFKEISASNMARIKVTIPSNHEQQEKIAKPLSVLDSKIEHNNELIQMLEEQAQLVYDYWFMQFDFPDENGRPYRSSGGKMVWSEELKREIPEGWSVKPCGEVFGVTRGKSYSSEEIEKGSTLMINLKNLAPYGGYNRNMEKPYSGTFTANHVAKEGDVLMGVTDMTRERRMVGYVLRVPHMEQECIFSMDLIKLLPIAVSPTFLYTSLYYGKYGKRFSPFAQGTNVLHLNPTAISRIPFVAPKKQVLELADSIFEGIYEKMDALEAENSLLAAQRDFLLPRLMSGEITVAE